MRTVLKNFRIIDESSDFIGSVVIEDGIITNVISCDAQIPGMDAADIMGAVVIDGAELKHQNAFTELPVLMPAFVDLHAHFRDPGTNDSEIAHSSNTMLPSEMSLPSEVSLPKEVLESASLAAAAGGFGTVVCMANTRPVIDSPEKAAALKKRSDVLGLIDLYPVMSLTKGMEGKELSGITLLHAGNADNYVPPVLSEDGRDITDDDIFFRAMKEAGRIGCMISCHCDFGGPESEALKKTGQPRRIWSRIEENNAVRRVIELGKKAGCHIHIAHVSTKEAVEIIRLEKNQTGKTKTENAGNKKAGNNGFTLTCEAMPHNFCLTEEDAITAGEETYGRVNPPLRTEEDRQALLRAISDGTIDAIATDHAPHSLADKQNGAPGFSGLETAFAASYSELTGKKSRCTVSNSKIDLKRLSSLMSANPARILGFGEPGNTGRGRILAGYRADLTIADLSSSWIVDPFKLKTRGKNTPFSGRELFGKILMTIHKGRVVISD